MNSKAIIASLSTLALLIPVVPANAQVSNNPSITKFARPLPISQWRFSRPNEDLRVPHSPKAESDWNRIAIISKPYRNGISGLKPFHEWAFENIVRDLGNSYSPQQKADWNSLSILTKPYR
jgi:hypothetical protein